MRSEALMVYQNFISRQNFQHSRLGFYHRRRVPVELDIYTFLGFSSGLTKLGECRKTVKKKFLQGFAYNVKTLCDDVRKGILVSTKLYSRFTK